MQLPDEIAGYTLELFQRGAVDGWVVRTKNGRRLIYVAKSEIYPGTLYLNINTYDQISSLRYEGDELGVYNEVLKFFSAERERENRAASR